jgi:hypothetical protein
MAVYGRARKVARWMADEPGLATVAGQRGRQALNPQAAGAEEETGYNTTSRQTDQPPEGRSRSALGLLFHKCKVASDVKWFASLKMGNGDDGANPIPSFSTCERVRSANR